MARRRTAPCPCGLGPDHEACCGRWSTSPAPTPELLMRSRYAAYARRDVDHLLRTWHPSTRPDPLVLDPGLRWTGLEVLGTSGGGLLDARGTVQFRARALAGSRTEVLEEDSLFVRDAGAWLYLRAR